MSILFWCSLLYQMTSVFTKVKIRNFKTLVVVDLLPGREKNPEECDATDDDSSNVAWPIKKCPDKNRGINSFTHPSHDNAYTSFLTHKDKDHSFQSWEQL
jgi:hypothetical protein